MVNLLITKQGEGEGVFTNLGEDGKEHVDGVGDGGIFSHDESTLESAVAVDETVDLGDDDRDEDEGRETKHAESGQDLEGHKELRKETASSCELSKSLELLLKITTMCVSCPKQKPNKDQRPGHHKED